MHAAPFASALRHGPRSMLASGHSTVRANAGQRTYRLEPGIALRFAVRQDGELRVTEGRLWITFDLPVRERRATARCGDHVVAAGEAVWLAAHDGIVLEPYDARCPAGFEWVPMAVAPGSVRAALADLRAAAVLAADALRRLLLPGLAQHTSCS